MSHSNEIGGSTGNGSSTLTINTATPTAGAVETPDTPAVVNASTLTTNSSSTPVSITNLGTGQTLYAGITSTAGQSAYSFKSITSGEGIVLTPNQDSISVSIDPSYVMTANGIVGSHIYIASSDPASNLGVNGDVAINSTSGNLFNKVSGAWTLQGSLKGATGTAGSQGATGAAGTNGLNGSQIYVLSSNPTTQGSNGDIAINSTSADLFSKVSGAWVLQGNIRGLQGLPGPKGDTGNTGAAGAAGSNIYALSSEPPSSTLGKNSDFAVISPTGNLYLNSYGTWSQVGNIRGPQGVAGPAGSVGVVTFQGRGGAVTLAASDLTSALSSLTASQAATALNLGTAASVNTSAFDAAGTAASAIVGLAPLSSPSFTGTPVAPTAPSSDNSTTLATTAFVKTQLTNLSYVHTFNGRTGTVILAGSDLTSALSGNTASQNVTILGLGTAAAANTSAFDAAGTAGSAAAAAIVGLASLASPTFTGTPSAPTPITSDNTTKIATTAFVKAQNYLTSLTISGDVSGSGSGSITLTLPTVNANVGTFTSVVVNAKGQVTAASNQTINVTGDATGSGTSSIALTLANSGVVAGTYNNVVVDGKGRVTSARLISSADVTTALGYTPINSSTGSFVSGVTVNVGTFTNTSALSLTSTTGSVSVIPSASAGSYNGLAQAGDQVIYATTGSAGTGNLVLGNLNSGSNGIRIAASGSHVVAGNLAVSGSLAVTGNISGSVIATGMSHAATLADRFADEINIVRDYGADPTGTNDSGAAIYLAMQQPGKKYLPPGTYVVGGVSVTGTPSITCQSPNVWLCGAGSAATVIKCVNPNVGVLAFPHPFCKLSDLKITYSSTPTSSAAPALTWDGFYGTIADIMIWPSYDAIVVKQNGGGTRMRNISLYDYVNTGLWLKPDSGQILNDVYINQFIFTADSTGGSAGGALGGLRITDNVQAFFASQGDVILGQYAMTIDASGGYGDNYSPAFCNFTNVDFDSGHLASASINGLLQSSFVDCWFSGGRGADQSTGTGPGAIFMNCNNIRLASGTKFVNCGGNGCNVQSTCTNMTFSDCAFDSNGLGGIGSYVGLNIAANTTDFMVRGCVSKSTVFPSNVQNYGIYVATGSSDRYIITQNLVSGNVTAGVFDGGSGTNKLVSANF